MTLPKFNDLISLTNLSEVDKEILSSQKILVELKMKRAINKQPLPHLFVQTKRRIAQLKTKRTLFLTSP
jgi:ribosomal protein L29